MPSEKSEKGDHEKGKIKENLQKPSQIHFRKLHLGGQPGNKFPKTLCYVPFRVLVNLQQCVSPSLEIML